MTVVTVAKWTQKDCTLENKDFLTRCMKNKGLEQVLDIKTACAMVYLFIELKTNCKLHFYHSVGKINWLKLLITVTVSLQ